MDKWDQEKLEEVIEKKHGAKEKCMPKTEIVSQFVGLRINLMKNSFKQTVRNNIRVHCITHKLRNFVKLWLSSSIQ